MIPQVVEFHSVRPKYNEPYRNAKLNRQESSLREYKQQGMIKIAQQCLSEKDLHPIKRDGKQVYQTLKIVRLIQSSTINQKKLLRLKIRSKSENQ